MHFKKQLAWDENETVMVSGGFDPLHIGHVQMIIEAAKWGDVVVILNSDEWLMREKKKVNMPWRERAGILAAIKGVVSVFEVNDADSTVCEAIRRLLPTYFANGGPRCPINTPETSACETLGIKLLWNVGGNKIQPRSELVEKEKEIESSSKNQ